jgi:putative ABC transport system permease protein
VVVTQDIAGSVNSMLGALDTVVVTIVICAGALAMTVLYNLTNINITERIREIATIKVLGFHANETAAYVFKENLLLSAMGVLCGMPGGWYLLKFVTSEIQVDMVYFQAALEPVSILLGVVLTMLAACLVDFLLYFKLEKINMAEALKSVE